MLNVVGRVHTWLSKCGSCRLDAVMHRSIVLDSILGLTIYLKSIASPFDGPVDRKRLSKTYLPSDWRELRRVKGSSCFICRARRAFDWVASKWRVPNRERRE